MVTNVAKRRQPFLFSEVVQRYSGDEKTSSGSFTSHYKPLLAAIAGSMTTRTWLDLRAGIGKVVKNLKISSENFLGEVGNIFGSHGCS